MSRSAAPQRWLAAWGHIKFQVNASTSAADTCRFGAAVMALAIGGPASRFQRVDELTILQFAQDGHRP